MTAFRPVIINNGTQSQLPNADSLLVGTGIDVSTAGALTIGGTTATSVTIGSASITTNFPGPVTLTGDVTTVGGTTFTTDATFEGNVTFGDAATDTVDFVAKVDSDIVFTGDGVTPPAYKISNLADPVSAQDAATKSYVDSAIGAGAAGANTEIQFNNSGAFGASANLTFDGTTFKANSAAVFNESGAAVDFRVESDTDANMLFVNGTTDRVGVGTATPSVQFEVSRSQNSDTDMMVSNANAGASAQARVLAYNDQGKVGLLSIRSSASTTTYAGIGSANAAVMGGGSSPSSLLIINDGTAAPIHIIPDTAAGSPAISALANGNVGIGTTSASSMFSVAEAFRVDSNGRLLEYNNAAPTDGQLLIGDTAAGYFKAATLTAGSGVSITNSAGGITITATGSGGTVTAVTASAPLASSGGTTPDISLTGIVAVANGGTNSSSYTAGSVIFAGAGGTSLTQDNANLFWDDSNDRLGIGSATPNEKLTVNGVISLAEGSAPSATTAFGKLYATSAADARPYWLDDTGQSYNLTADRFNTLTAGASVAIDASPALPLFNTVSIDQATTFTTSNLGNGRSASVRVVCDGTTRALTWPAGWTWLGSGAPTSIAANDVGYLSIVAFGATDNDVVAGWSYENSPVSVTGSGVDNQIAVWSGTYSQDGSATLTFDGTTFSADSAAVFNESGAAVDFRVEGDTDANLLFVDGSADFVGIGTASPSAKLTVSGGLTQSSGAVSLTGNAASSLTTSSGALTLTSAAAATWSTSAGALTLTSAAAATWSTAAGNLAISGAANLELTAGSGSAVVVNEAGADVDFRVESDNNANMLLVDASADAVAIGTTGVTHTFNIGSGSSVGFAVASGGRIHTYDGSNPTDGQILIGDTALGNFAKATLTAGTGVSVTNGAGAITLAATGTVPLTTTGLTAGDVCYASSNSTGGAAVATAAGTSRVLGFVATVGGPGTIQVTGIYTGANFITGLTGLAAGQPVFLSKTSGKLTNDVSAFTTGDVVAEIGIAVNVSSATGGAAAADVLIQPKSIFVL